MTERLILPKYVDYVRERYVFPQPLLDGLERYVNDKIPTGSFLRAVLENDLRDAVARADAESLKVLPGLVILVHMELPSECHGSPEAVAAWLAETIEVELQQLPKDTFFTLCGKRYKVSVRSAGRGGPSKSIGVVKIGGIGTLDYMPLDIKVRVKSTDIHSPAGTDYYRWTNPHAFADGDA